MLMGGSLCLLVSGGHRISKKGKGEKKKKGGGGGANVKFSN